VELAGHTDTIDRCAFTADAKWIVSSGWDGHCFVWDVERQERRADIGRQEKGGSAWSLFTDGAHVLFGRKGSLGVWRLSDGAEVASLTGLVGLVESCAVARSGTALAIGTEDGQMRLITPLNLPLKPRVPTPLRPNRVASRDRPRPQPRTPAGSKRSDEETVNPPVGSLAAMQKALAQLPPDQYAAFGSQYPNLPLRPGKGQDADHAASTNADRAMRLNAEYQASLSAWLALPWFRRMVTKRPVPPGD
jgi:hypothetical protein